MIISEIKKLNEVLKRVYKTNECILFFVDGCQLQISKVDMNRLEGKEFTAVHFDNFNYITQSNKDFIRTRMRQPNHKINPTHTDFN